MWSWICYASSLWFAILQRVPEKIVPISNDGESQVENHQSGVQHESCVIGTDVGNLL
jgi:hypothetical protein